MRAPIVELPSVGLGCYPYREGRRVDLGGAIELAVEIGYRLLDTAEAYGNEAQIGDILRRRRRRSGSPPLVVSKVWQTNHAYDDALAACEDSIDRLGVDVLDIYLIHSPEAWRHTGPLGDLSRHPVETARDLAMPSLANGDRAMAPVSLAETWSAMEELHRRGLVRAIGVSNFSRAQLEEVLAGATVKPSVHQIELHPYRPHSELVAFCHERGIRVMAHSPLSSPGLLADPMLTKIAQRHGRSPAQVVLNWSVARGAVPIPGSRDERRLRENLQALDFSLEASDLAEIDSLSDS